MSEVLQVSDISIEKLIFLFFLITHNFINIFFMERSFENNMNFLHFDIISFLLFLLCLGAPFPPLIIPSVLDSIILLLQDCAFLLSYVLIILTINLLKLSATSNTITINLQELSSFSIIITINLLMFSSTSNIIAINLLMLSSTSNIITINRLMLSSTSNIITINLLMSSSFFPPLKTSSILLWRGTLVIAGLLSFHREHTCTGHLLISIVIVPRP